MVFGLSSRSSQPTFKTRVESFWLWFAEHADRLYETIETGDSESLTDEMVAMMQDTLPEMSWVFGPGEGGGHSLTVTGEGDVPKQILAAAWLEQAVELKGWTFYASRQPSSPEELRTMEIAISETEAIDADSFLVATTPNDEAQKFDIIAWHPLLSKVPDEHHMTLLFLLLDEALGEFGTEQWLGAIDLQPIPDDAKSMSVVDLPAFLDQAQRYHGWEKIAPLEAYTAYQPKSQSTGPRGDTIAGTTMTPNLVFELIENKGKLKDNPLAGTGAEFAYLRFPTSMLPSGQEADTRGNIEDAIHDVLQAQFSGQVTGGACGIRESYVDMILLDGQQSHDLVNATVEKLCLRGNPKLELIK